MRIVLVAAVALSFLAGGCALLPKGTPKAEPRADVRNMERTTLDRL